LEKVTPQEGVQPRRLGQRRNHREILHQRVEEREKLHTVSGEENSFVGVDLPVPPHAQLRKRALTEIA